MTAAVVALYLASVLVGAVTVVTGLRSTGRTVASLCVAVALTGGALWNVGALLTALSSGEAAATWFAVVTPPSVTVAVTGFWGLLHAVADKDWQPSRRMLLGLAVQPAVMLVLGLTNPLHHLVADPTTDAFHGPLFWLHSVYSYGLLAGGLVHALRARRSAPLLRSNRLTAMVLAGLAPGAGTVVQLTLLPPRTPDLAPILFVATGLVCTWLLARHHALSLLPVARAQVLDQLGDAVAVLDENDVVLDANVAALHMLEVAARPTAVVGRPAAEALGDVADVLTGREGEREVAVGDRTVVLDVRVHALTDRRRRAMGRVVVVRDVTHEAQARAELAAANEALRAHVATIEALRAEVAEQAVRDPVTGLHNRRYLDAVLRALVTDAGAALADVPVTLVMLDADHFKCVNDTHGHAVGDRVLEALATALASATGPREAVVRFGGEEFVVVLPGADLATGVARAEDLRRRCAEAVVTTREGAVGVTVSAGVATTGPGRATADALLEAADRALYAAKHAGRDRVAAADEPAVV